MGSTILLADKSVTIQKIVQLTFADEDFQITCVNDGQSALEAISLIRPAIILADIGLPVKNGYDLCRSLRTDSAMNAYKNTPLILLAGIYETMDEDRARVVEEKVKEVGANALLSKPFDPQLLTAKVKELIAQSAPSAPTIFTATPAIAEEEIFSHPTAPRDLHFQLPPPDDNERTMMLPGVPDAGSSMFADAPPLFEEEAPPAPKRPVDIDAVKPLGEVVFEESELEALPEDVPEPEAPEIEYVEEKYESPAFPGFDEPLIEPPIEEAFAPPPPPAVESEPAVVSDFEDPFGEDVFAAPASTTAWSPAAAASEEESPFGLPEPPPPPPAPPAPPEPEPQMVAVEEAFNEPEILEEPSPSMDESDREQMEEMMGTPESLPDIGEDTWSRAKAATEQEQPVEELFETTETEEPQPVVEEAVELQADITSPGIKLPVIEPEPEAELVAEPEPLVPVMAAAQPAVSMTGPGQAVEITDEAVERIARRVVELLSDRVVAEIVWQVVPELAEKMIRRELEKLHAGTD